MTDEEFDERLAEFWAEIEAPGGEQGVELLIRAAARMSARIANPVTDEDGA